MAQGEFERAAGRTADPSTPLRSGRDDKGRGVAKVAWFAGWREPQVPPAAIRLSSSSKNLIWTRLTLSRPFGTQSPGQPRASLAAQDDSSLKYSALPFPALLSFKLSAGVQATTNELHELASTAGIEPATSAVSSGALPTEKYPLSTPPPKTVVSLETLPLLCLPRVLASPESQPASANCKAPRGWPAWSLRRS